MLLREVFNQPAAWQVEFADSDEIHITFDVADAPYSVRIIMDNLSDDVEVATWDINFSYDGGEDADHSINGVGNAQAVFATMVDIIKNFVNTTAPDVVRFSAKEPSRIKLYQRIIKHTCPTWKTKVTQYSDQTTFVIINPNGMASDWR